ncbi:MAG: adenylosuccinate synthase [bacterium]|nr:adenylosuccinate synthase [Planctomycetota bacterium]HIL51998.1 adenylosuccinate synthase [Planctomycetota bacterium]
MPSISVFGAQWGDEGKGKIIDLLSRDVDFVVRYQGGANAGHTVIVGGEKYVLHLIPSGILHKGRVNVIGNGLAVDPLALMEEIQGLCERGVQVTGENLRLSRGAHVIFQHHRRADQLAERWLGEGRIGTTGRGMGPCYADKAARTGLRIGDLLEADRCRTRLQAALAEKNALFEKVHGEEALDLDTQLDIYMGLGDQLRPFVGDTGAEVRRAYDEGKSVLFEGAQGVMLDIDHGTYPFVTSSNTGTGGVPAGAAFPAQNIDRAIGIAKAYCTRVGEGPFPSEDHGAEGQAIREAGCEYGATTGRPRRCGWFDAVAVRYALELNGAESLVMTNLDVLSGFPELRAAVAYDCDGERLEDFPAFTPLERFSPIFESHPGWTEDITGVREFADLPPAAQSYVTWIEEIVGRPISMLSVGPSREQIIPRGL